MEMKLTESNWTELWLVRTRDNSITITSYTRGFAGQQVPTGQQRCSAVASELPKDKIKVINQVETYYPLTADN